MIHKKIRDFFAYRINSFNPFIKAILFRLKYSFQDNFNEDYLDFLNIQIKYLLLCLIGISKKHRESIGKKYEISKNLSLKKQYQELQIDKEKKYISIGLFKLIIPNNYEEFLNLLFCYDDIVIQDKYFQTKNKICGDIVFPIYRYGGGEGPYEIKKVQIVPGDIIIDAGSNIGIFSILAAKKGAKEVYAFEPSPYIHTFLNNNIKENNLENIIRPITYGLYSRKSSLEFIQTEGNIGSSGFAITNETKDGLRYYINVISLDEWIDDNNIEKVDFIKADVEGAERYLLEGAKKTIRKYHPKLSLCTYHLPDDAEVLSKMILEIDDSYNIFFGKMKLFAW